MTVGVAVAHQRRRAGHAGEVLAQQGVEAAAVLGEEEGGLEVGAGRGEERGAVGDRLLERLFMGADHRRVLVADQAEEAEALAAARELDHVGIDRRPRIARDHPLLQPAVVEGGGEAVGVAPLGGHRPGQVHELVRRLDVEAVARRVVDLVIGGRRQLARIPCFRRIVQSFEGVQSHASSLRSGGPGVL